MIDLEQRLSGLGTGGSVPDDASIDADLTRGRRALRDRRARRVTLVGVLSLGAAAAVAIGVGAQGDPPPKAAPGQSSPSPRFPVTPPPTPTAPPTSTAPPITRDLRLVAYEGRQRPGFRIETVPEGFVLQGVDGAVLAVAPPGNHTPISDFSHKLVITVTPKTLNPPDPKGDPVRVQGHPGTIVARGDGSVSLDYVIGDRVVDVQAWADLGLTRAQMLRFAEGITVTSSAELVS